MFVVEGRIVYSASDLAAATRCEYALMRSFDYKLGWGPEPQSDEDELLRRAARLGDAHERRWLDDLTARYGNGVIRIDRPQMTLPALTAAAQATADVFTRDPAAVYQAAMFDGRMLGFADFVIRADTSTPATYRVCDTKLARSVRKAALLQLAAYAHLLAAAGVPVAADAELILGDRTCVRYPVDELLPVYRRQRERLQRLLDDHLASRRPVRWGDRHVRACFRCAECRAKVRDTDDVLLVAGLRVSQRESLIDAGITTLTGLAAHRGEVKNMSAHASANLIAQARLQIRERATSRPQYQVADPLPLREISEPNAGDLFFDFEGDPLWTADGVDWGLEYLFGVLEANGTYRPLWAHDRASEREALADFLALVRRRIDRHPNMHIYHYAAYEQTALLRLGARHGVGEDEIADLLRSGILVDLYPVVRKSIRVGAGSYGLKAIEPLYLGHRQGEVTSGAGSITEYARYCALRDDGRAQEATQVLNTIGEYNRLDCRSTQVLRDWLLMRAFEPGITHLTGPVVAPVQTFTDAGRTGRALDARRWSLHRAACIPPWRRHRA